MHQTKGSSAVDTANLLTLFYNSVSLIRSPYILLGIVELYADQMFSYNIHFSKPFHFREIKNKEKMLEGRSEDALVLLVKLVKLDC